MNEAGPDLSSPTSATPGAVPPPPTAPAFPTVPPFASTRQEPEPAAQPEPAAPSTPALASPEDSTPSRSPWARPLERTEQPSTDERATEQPPVEQPVVEQPDDEPDLDMTRRSHPVQPTTPQPAPAPALALAPQTDPRRQALVDTVAAALLAAAEASGRTWASVNLEWSQAGTQHSGRTYVLTPEDEMVRLDVPDTAVSALAELRTHDAAPGVGTWLAAHASLTPGDDGALDLAVDHDARPYWNSPALRMLLPEGAAPPAQPVPSDEQWLADLAAFPRDSEHVPAWLRSSTAGPGAAGAALRRRLDEARYPADAVVLPGDPPGATPLEGALELRQTGAHRFSVGVRDYGVFEAFHTSGTEREACDWLWNLLVAPLPAATPVAVADLQYRSHSYQGAYAQIFGQLSAGGGALLTTLPPGVALDRLGSIDGLFLFPWATPIPNRSLPPTASGPSTRLYQFVTTQPLHVEAEIVPPWFGQPGGSLRFRIAADGVGVRQLVTAGALMEVRVAQ